MKGHVRREAVGGKTFYRLVINIGEREPAKRCLSDSCAKRFVRRGREVVERPLWWMDGEEPPPETCPNCRGTLTDTLERRSRWAGPFRTKREAESELARLINVQAEGGDPFPPRCTVREFSDRWLSQKRRVARVKTHQRYAEIIRDHVVPVIGSVELTALKPGHVHEVLSRARERGLSEQTALHVYRVVHNCLAWAMKQDLIRQNPAVKVDAPRPKRKTLTIPTAKQMNTLIEAARGTEWETLMTLHVATGARRSELLALTWDAVDLRTARIHIRSGLHWTRVQGFYIEEPKSDRSRRSMPLPAFAVASLGRHRATQASSLRGLVFHQDGEYINPHVWSSAFGAIAKKAGISCRLHDLRHGWVSALAARNVPIMTVSRLAGHSTAAFTLDRYGHLFPDDAEVAATAIADALGNART